MHMTAVHLLLLALVVSVDPPKGYEVIHHCHPGADGVLEGGMLHMPIPVESSSGLVNWPSATIESNGPPDNRIDLVFVGDGFQESELKLYAAATAHIWYAMLEHEPYASYRSFFNVHRVDVTSAESGVDNDPIQGISRETALDMGFWCGGIERALCVNSAKARQAALAAPGSDHVLAVANSTKYGGVAYLDELATFSAFNEFSLPILLHELGHSFGGLADEYDYKDGAAYSGPEPDEQNVSILNSADMHATQSKWWQWLGVSLKGVGLHGAFEGAAYHQFGIYRPTATSLMRSVDFPFNGPGLEQMILAIHDVTKMIDRATPAVASDVNRGTRVSVDALQPSSHQLSMQWYLGSEAIPGATSMSVDTANLPLPASGMPLRVVLTDPTPYVRDEAMRSQTLRESYSWTLRPDALVADLNLDGGVDGLDLTALLSSWGVSGLSAGRADVNGDGTVDGSDLAAILAAWGASGTPPPQISAVTPGLGSTSGGTAITLTGTNLNGAISVTVGGMAATNVKVVSRTTVTAVTPPGTAGSSDVVVTTPGGAATRTGGFMYLAAPTLVSIAPASGTTAGGTIMTLTGTSLTGASSVTVGGTPATSVQVVNSTTVTAVTPAGAAGVCDVTVTTPGGAATRTGGFTYASVTVPSWATLLEPLPDPTVVTSATLRSAITATGYAWRVRDTATQIEMVLIPPGTFQMGCSPSNQYGCRSDETPVHTVTLTNLFYMGRYEVTQAQWTARMGSNPSNFRSSSTLVPASQVASRPVEQVSWNMIQGFCSGTGLRLPSEAEWEYAYRAGTTTAFHSMPGHASGTNGDSLLGNIGWANGYSGNQTRPVGQKAGNGFGLHDMSGNVYEWVSDWYSASYYASSPSVNPPGPSSGSFRVLRGGSWGSSSEQCRSSFRFNFFPPSFVNPNFGFRVARNP
jgi:formylglycine-generating enzyme required for sulfatase activity